MLSNFDFGEALEGHFDRARRFFEENLTIVRSLGERAELALALHNLGDVARYQADYATASRLLDKSLALCREVGDKRLTSLTLLVLGLVAQC